MISGGRGSRSDAIHCAIRSRLTGLRGMSQVAWATCTPRGARSSQLRSTTCAAVGLTACVQASQACSRDAGFANPIRVAAPESQEATPLLSKPCMSMATDRIWF
jgi:hypothetical protein